MSNMSLGNINYYNENKKYLEGYDCAKSGMENVEKYQHLFKNVSKDSFEKAEEMTVLCSENYSKVSRLTGMPQYSLGDAFGREMKHKIESYMSDYYAGNKSKEEVETFFEECCMAMRTYRTGQFQTSGYSEIDNEKIVSELFEYFCKVNQRAAIAANKKEGEEINKEYGGNSHGETNRGYAYYNSDYYYKCETMRDVFRGMAGKVAKKWEIAEIDLAEVEKNTVYTLDGGLDFNSGWNHTYRNNMGVGSMIDETKAPPKDFKLFFNATVGTTMWGGILKFDSGDIHMEREVPFEYKGEDIFNVSELLEYTTSEDKEEQRKLNEFFKNFEIFTLTYSSGEKLSWVRGNYQEKAL